MRWTGADLAALIAGDEAATADGVTGRPVSGATSSASRRQVIDSRAITSGKPASALRPVLRWTDCDHETALAAN